jgi:hypothetical protein
MNWLDELKLTFEARIAVVNLVTNDEADTIRALVEFAHTGDWPQGMGLFTWDIGDQFVELKAPAKGFAKKEAAPETVLRLIDGYEGSATFILKDFHQVWEAKRSNVRVLRNLTARLPDRSEALNLILLTPEANLPLELKQDVPAIEVGKPDAARIERLLEREARASRALSGIAAGMRRRMIEATLGLSAVEAGRAFRKAIVAGGSRLDDTAVERILDEKRRIIRESGALELYPYSGMMSDVGGLGALKKWLDERQEAFTDEAREYGLDTPKGVALIGIPGTGKSLCAKVTAGLWRMPLLRMDVGAVFSGVLGSSERNIREAIRIAEVIAPCVLWVDEVEKGLAGSAGDSGTASRVMATFLTWMQEKTAPVFVFATANDVSRLPPEFLRKGRFDEVFFLDLPTRAERAKIIEVHLKRHDFTMTSQRFDVNAVADATEGYVGAELEALVSAAMFPAFRDKRRQLDTEDLLRAAGDMVPLAISHEKHIGILRTMVTSGQARNASDDRAGRQVELDKLPVGRGGGRVVDV